jgi:hypothetical protein
MKRIVSLTTLFGLLLAPPFVYGGVGGSDGAFEGSSHPVFCAYLTQRASVNISHPAAGVEQALDGNSFENSGNAYSIEATDLTDLSALLRRELNKEVTKETTQLNIQYHQKHFVLKRFRRRNRAELYNERDGWASYSHIFPADRGGFQHLEGQVLVLVRDENDKIVGRIVINIDPDPFSVSVQIINLEPEVEESELFTDILARIRISLPATFRFYLEPQNPALNQALFQLEEKLESSIASSAFRTSVNIDYRFTQRALDIAYSRKDQNFAVLRQISDAGWQVTKIQRIFSVSGPAYLFIARNSPLAN